MKKPVRGRPRLRRSTAARPDDPLARSPLIRKSHAFLLGTAVAMFVAAVLIPSEAATAFGSHVVLVMAWLVLTAAWLTRCLLAERPVWHVGPVGAAFGVFLVLHSVSAVITMPRGHGRPALNALWLWISFGLMFLTVRQLVRRGTEQRALASMLAAVAVGLSTFGLYQTAYVYPRIRADYGKNPAQTLREAGMDSTDPAQQRHFEDRLMSSEPVGPFALTNSLAGVLAPSLMVLLGLSLPWWRSLRKRRWRVVVGAFVLGVVLTCLILTKSRSAYLAALAGLGTLAVSSVVPRTGWRWRFLALSATVIVLIGACIAFFGGLDRAVLTEAPKSLGYRFQYWESSAAMIADHPWWGCGPGNFKDYYTQYKLPEASETIAEPHNFLVEVTATAGIPALIAFLLLLTLLFRQAGRRRGQPVDTAGDALEPTAARPVYLGLGAGFLVAYPVGWAGGQSPAFDMLWVALPAALAALWVFHPWVIRGRVPSQVLLIAMGTLLVHLLAAGGISFPGVAGLLWVLAALAVNVAEKDEPTSASGRSNWLWGPIVGRVAIGVTTAGIVLLLLFSYVTMYRPVLADHEYTAFCHHARTRAMSYASAEIARRSRHAAETDPWWAAPCARLADVLHYQWLADPTPARLADFDQAAAAARQRSPRSSEIASTQGHRLMAMYAASGNTDLLERAVAAYTRAVRLYPNSNLMRAHLAWACELAGDLKQAQRQAAQALWLDDRMPHEELKLKNQTLKDVISATRRGEGSPGQDSLNAEQLMRRIRKLDELSRG